MNTTRTAVRISALALALTGAGLAGHAVAPAPVVAAPPLVCGAYTTANADSTGCEMLPHYLAVPSEDMRRLTVSHSDAVKARDKARGHVTDLRATLTDTRAELADVTGQRDDLAGDLQQAKNSLADVTPETHTSASDPLDVARGDATLSTWQGFTVGEVILCPAGFTVSVDDAGKNTWAACM